MTTTREKAAIPLLMVSQPSDEETPLAHFSALKNNESKETIAALWTEDQLRNRAMQLDAIDNSLSTKFKCCSNKSAREKAGFTEMEILAIERQKRLDWEAKLNNPSYLRERSLELRDTDNSCSATFFGKEYARKNAGFRPGEIKAIELQVKRDKEEREKRKIKRDASNLFTSLSPAPLINQHLKKRELAAIKDRQDERTLKVSLQQGRS